MKRALTVLAASVALAAPQPPRSPYRSIFVEECGQHYLDREAQSWVESRWNPRAVSPVGAMGLMQNMPGTFREYKTRGWIPQDADPFDPRMSIRGGHRYMVSIAGNWSLRAPLWSQSGIRRASWASYNAGEGNIRAAFRLAKRLGIPGEDAWRETLPQITKNHAQETLDYTVRIERAIPRLAPEEGR